MQELPITYIFSLKHLLLFTKCTNLSNNIELYIKNDYPMIIRYGVANLGEIKLCLSPKLYNEFSIQKNNQIVNAKEVDACQ